MFRIGIDLEENVQDSSIEYLRLLLPIGQYQFSFMNPEVRQDFNFKDLAKLSNQVFEEISQWFVKTINR